MKPMRSELRTILSRATLACLPALACGEVGVDDQQPLRTLSASELGELCDEVQGEWPSSEESIECSDGTSVSFARPPRGTCGDVDFSECPATVGELRECTRALMEDPCSSSRRLPDACQELEQAGCGDARTGGELASICPEAPEDQLAALEGVYELTSHARSELACTYQGDSVLALDRERLLVIVAGSVLGRPAALLESCSEMAACRAKVTELRERLGDTEIDVVLEPIEVRPELQRSFMCRADSPGAVLAQTASVGPRSDANCVLTSTETKLTRAPGGALHIESRTFRWEKPVLNDECIYTAGEKPGSAPCTALEVHDARFVAAL